MNDAIISAMVSTIRRKPLNVIDTLVEPNIELLEPSLKLIMYTMAINKSATIPMTFVRITDFAV